jgi:Probable taurine catabolism dioxygenase
MQQTKDPAAWTRESVGGKPGITVTLEEAHLSEIESILARTRGRALQEIEREDFAAPQLNALLAGVRKLLLRGPGAVLIDGVTPERFRPEDFEKIFWGVGTHLGRPAVQSMRGDRLGYVQMETDTNTTGRGSRSSAELYPHTDAFELVGLMCVRKAESGGLSRLVSALGVHNEILRTRPELMPALYRGFPQAVFEAKFSAQPVTPYDIPVFSCVEGYVSCLYSRLFINAAAEKLGRPLPDDLVEALDYFEQLNNGDVYGMDFLLEPGEMLFWNNYVVLHARTAFKDTPEHRRLLLRLWLDVTPGRPVVPPLAAHGMLYERLYRDAAAAQA